MQRATASLVTLAFNRRDSAASASTRAVWSRRSVTSRAETTRCVTSPWYVSGTSWKSMELRPPSWRRTATSNRDEAPPAPLAMASRTASRSRSSAADHQQVSQNGCPIVSAGTTPGISIAARLASTRIPSGVHTPTKVNSPSMSSRCRSWTSCSWVTSCTSAPMPSTVPSSVVTR